MPQPEDILSIHDFLTDVVIPTLPGRSQEMTGTLFLFAPIALVVAAFIRRFAWYGIRRLFQGERAKLKIRPLRDIVTGLVFGLIIQSAVLTAVQVVKRENDLSMEDRMAVISLEAISATPYYAKTTSYLVEDDPAAEVRAIHRKIAEPGRSLVRHFRELPEPVLYDALVVSDAEGTFPFLCLYEDGVPTRVGIVYPAELYEGLFLKRNICPPSYDNLEVITPKAAMWKVLGEGAAAVE